MKKTALVSAATILLLSACQSIPEYQLLGDAPAFHMAAKPDAELAEVWVDNGRIVVNQEPIYARDDPDTAHLPTSDTRKKKKVTWLLDSDYTFPADNAIVLCPSAKTCTTRPSDPDCQRHGMRKVVCTYRWAPRNTQYHYSITVIDGTNTLHLDPSIMN